MTNRHPKALMSEALGREPGDELNISIRELLGVWGHRHRDFDIVTEMRANLAVMGLTTEPPFDTGPSSTTVRLIPVQDAEAEQRQDCTSTPLETLTAMEGPTTPLENEEDSEPTSSSHEPPPATPLPSDGVDDEVFPQVSLRVRDLDSATRGVTSVSPEQSLQTAHTLMMKHDYSQLPVLADAGTLLGVVSWESIACAWVTNSDVT
ncbi:MAG: CBS domain-containing protein [Pseudonocardiaceae bacterium]